jgi:hypothetical protein
MKMKLLTAAFVLLLFSCRKNISAEENGTVRDYTGLDGCGMVIVLDKGDKLEPISVPAGVTLTDGRRVAVKYRKRDDRVSACMVGPIVDVVSLRYL